MGNRAFGAYGLVVGGNVNTAAGSHSIAMGSTAIAEADSSMVINLDPTEEVASTIDGQVLVNAKQIRFQLTNNPGVADNNVIVMTESNLANLRAAIAEQ